ncbi:hypothetical protein CKO15_13645 [Halorhodospira abdelmalekii]|uniref:hypothetical protein n=1 Tax=Halorhodospira abdelmalekii TaxID=421629 RepID=UPI0019040BF4|nr:hypothetical protein [Halorhodospira abdelmalekii]MBK1736284.1 hypothetical protein [Halorhodospira abdelmalekii]
MATKKPRIALTLEPEVYRTIERFAELSGQPKSRVISELIEQIHEPLQRTVALLDAANSAPQQVRKGLQTTLEQMEREMVGNQGSAAAQIGWVTEKLIGGTEPVSEADDPPLVTRGSGFWSRGVERRFRVEDYDSGESWKQGLTWSGDAATKALQQANRTEPGRQWILREVDDGQ